MSTLNLAHPRLLSRCSNHLSQPIIGIPSSETDWIIVEKVTPGGSSIVHFRPASQLSRCRKRGRRAFRSVLVLLEV